MTVNGLSSANQQMVKILNKRYIVNSIRRSGQLSRIQQSKDTNLMPATVSSLTSELLEKGYIVETGSGESSGGRKPIMLAINPTALYTLCVDVRFDRLTAAIFDFKGDLWHKETYVPHTESIIDSIIKVVDGVLGKNVVENAKIDCLGIIISGIIDSAREKIMLSSMLNIKDFNIRKVLEDKFKKSVRVEHSANAALIEVIRRENISESENVVFISIKNGIGMSMFINGKIYNPSNASAGEIGHTTIDRNGVRCTCGNTGCLVTLVSEQAALRLAYEAVKKGVTTVLRDFYDRADGSLLLENIISAEKEGDFVARQIFHEMGDAFGVTAANVINLLNPSILVFAGDFFKVSSFRDSTYSTLKYRGLDDYIKNTKILISDYNEDIRLYGMAMDILENEVFKI